MREERYIGIDYLRSLFSVCVVLVHIGYISPSMIFSKEFYLEHAFTVSDFINFYLLLLAVPIFFIISNYLFFQKPEDKSVLLIFLLRIGKIAVFWMVLYSIFRFKGWEIIDWLPKSTTELVSFIVSGGHTIYYFFISLIGLTIITHFSKRLCILHVLVLFIVTTILLLILPILSVATGFFLLSIYWNPLNFLPYPFAAILVFHITRLDKAKIKPIYIVLAGFIIFILVVLDWTIYVNKGFFNVHIFAIPAYTRPSLVLIAMAVLLVATRVNPRRNAVVLFMSKNSLELYCLHPFFLEPAKQLSGGNLLISLLLVVFLSYLTGMIMKQFVKQELIM